MRQQNSKKKGENMGSSPVTSNAATKYDIEAKKSLNVEGDKSGRILVSEEEDVSGFVAFNADYHSPRHHPPKNN